LQSEQQYSNLVYEYFLTRIQFRYYKCGDCLPSIDTLCRELCVSAQTVKMALKRLRSEGYIDMHNGRSTKVIFQQDQETSNQCILRYFSCRIHSFQDLFQSVGLIMHPLLTESFYRADERDLACLARLAEGSCTDDVLHFFCFVLQKIDNPLVMNLYWEASIYWGLLFLKHDDGKDLSDVALLHDEIEHCVLLAENKEWNQLARQLQIFRQDSIGRAVDLLTQRIPPAENVEHIPFVWRIYRERPQVCYSLAAWLLHEIYIGCYREAEFLPSYENMAAAYGVSVSTIRRTVKVLNQLGAVRSINGKGTMVFGIGAHCDSPDFTSPVVRRNLAFFFQSFELLVYSCETVMQHCLSSASREEKSRLTSRLEQDLAHGRQELSLWRCLLFVTKCSPLKGIREIYGRIYSLFLWGYPLKASHDGNPALDEAILRFTDTMIQGLKGDDIAGCCQAIKILVTQQFPAAEQYLLNQGLQPEDLRLNPSIRLLISDEDT
jgi:DNA-binding GntR family transcriptional regulator